jgi:cell division protein FtsZ
MPVDFSKMDIERMLDNSFEVKGKVSGPVQNLKSVDFENDPDFVSDEFIVPKIRTLVVSCGNAGGNILKHIVTKNACADVEYVMTDTDYMALNAKRLPNCKVMLLGEKTCKGFGAGMHPEIAEAAARESEEKLRNILRGSSLVFLIAGEGGGSGTGCSPIVARIAKEEGAIVIAMVTKPFRFEGKVVMNRAINGISELRKEVDAIEVIDNQKVYCIGDANIPASVRFGKIDEFVSDMVAGFVNVTRDTSTIKLDFQDLKKTLEECKGDMFIGVGESAYKAPSDNSPWDFGENAMMEAVERAISCPLIDGVNMQNAKGMIALYLVGNDIPLEVLEKAQDLINKKTDEENANIVWGADFNEKMNGRIKVFFIVAGLNSLEDERKGIESNIIRPSIFEKGEKIAMFENNNNNAMKNDIPTIPNEPIETGRVGATPARANASLKETGRYDAITQKIMPVSMEAKVEANVIPKPKTGNIYGLAVNNKAQAQESGEKQHTPSIHGFEKTPDFLRIQCQ